MNADPIQATVNHSQAAKNATKAAVSVESLPGREAAEAQRRYDSFCNELKPSGEVGFALVNRAATLSVRMERCVMQETASLAERVRRAIAEFVPPEGASAAEVDRLRAEAGTRAMFDASKEASEARKYEAAAERGFFRALKELRLLAKAAEAAEKAHDDHLADELGSFLSEDKLDAELDAIERQILGVKATKPSRKVASSTPAPPEAPADVPITIGKRR